MTADQGPGGADRPGADQGDPRYMPGAYVTYDRRLYDVVGLDETGRLRVINSLTDEAVTLSLYHMRLVQLVRKAPTIRVPDTVA